MMRIAVISSHFATYDTIRAHIRDHVKNQVRDDLRYVLLSHHQMTTGLTYVNYGQQLVDDTDRRLDLGD
jgi:hypothetical protein